MLVSTVTPTSGFITYSLAQLLRNLRCLGIAIKAPLTSILSRNDIVLIKLRALEFEMKLGTVFKRKYLGHRNYFDRAEKNGESFNKKSFNIYKKVRHVSLLY